MIWGTAFLWIKLSLQEVSPLVLVAFRTLFGTITSLVIILLGRKVTLSWQLLRPWLGIFALLGFTNAAMPFMLVAWGEQYISSGVASVLNSTTPLFTIFLAAFLLRENQLTAIKTLGLLVGFGGVVVLFLPQFSQGRIENILGPAAVLMVAFLYAISGIIIKRKVHGLDSELQVLLQYVFAAMMVWGVTLLVEKPFVFPSHALTWTGLVWLGVEGSVASTLYFKLLHEIGPIRSSTVMYIMPLVGLLLGAITLSETLGWQTLIGGGLIIAGIMLVNRF